MIKPAKTILVGQAVFTIGIVLCTVLMPQFLFAHDEGGISNFGTHALTILPFTLAFIGVGLSLVIAASTLPLRSRGLPTARELLLLLGSLTLLTAVSTYSYRSGGLLHALHLILSQLLFIVEIPSAAWFWSRTKKVKTVSIFFVLYVLGVIASILAITGALRVLFVAEMLSSISLGCMLAYAVEELSIPNR